MIGLCGVFAEGNFPSNWFALDRFTVHQVFLDMLHVGLRTLLIFLETTLPFIKERSEVVFNLGKMSF